MPTVTGCVIPVEGSNRERFVEQARKVAPLFRDLGATGVVDTIGVDVPRGEVTDFHRCVAARDGELISFGWVAWPDRDTQTAAEARMMSDPAMDMADMPFDGQRMILGTFEPVVVEGPGGAFGYVDGFVLAVPSANREAFVRHCREAASLILRHGATRHVECWGVDVPAGEVTDFARAVRAGPDETVCFSWIEWPDRATRDAGQKGIMADMETMMDNPMPFDGKRMIFGGFQVVGGEG